MAGWQISEIDGNGFFHVVPVNDLQEHMDENCPCNPTPDEEMANLIMHNSFDGREAFETGERKMS